MPAAPPPAPQLRGERAREAVLVAAEELFGAQGYRRTSIEDLARRAGVSRPTVYAHFGSKEEVFRTVVAAVHAEQMEAMETAAERDGDVAERLFGVLAARFGRIVELTSASPHARELLDENSKVCGDITGDARRRSLRVLESLLHDAESRGELDLGRTGLSARAAAAVVYDCAHGAKEDGTLPPPAYRRRLRQVVAALLGGLAAGR